MSKGGLVISALNQLVDLVEEHLSGEIDINGWAGTLATTEYHLRRMFSSLAGMPLSEYVRRRRMTVAAADVVSGRDDLLSIAVRHGYGSTEAFGRAFRAVHGASPGDVRRDGGPLRAQPQLRFRLTVEGRTPMDTRIVNHPAFRLVGHAAQVPLVHQGVNPHIRRHVAALPQEEHLRLKAMGNTGPARLLAVSDDLDPFRALPSSALQGSRDATGLEESAATGRRATRVARDRRVPWPGPLRSWRAGVNAGLGRPSRRRSDPVIGRGVAGEIREVRQYVGVAS
jgi:AraC-like DNA-binding protein